MGEHQLHDRRFLIAGLNASRANPGVYRAAVRSSARALNMCVHAELDGEAVEYDYYDFGTKTVGTSVSAAGFTLPLAATSKLTEQTVKFGASTTSSGLTDQPQLSVNSSLRDDGAAVVPLDLFLAHYSVVSPRCVLDWASMVGANRGAFGAFA